MNVRSFSRRLAHAAAIVALAAAAQAHAYEPIIDDTPSAEAMTFDLFVVRPLSLVGTVVGTAVYVVALPINLITFNLVDPARRLIVEPAKYTFTRDLGDLR
jgi:hypothetical protein